ncbi:OLC1v1031809C1 [Oldenlandia corymbosa var. corymbosa]|uniref:Protein transport protein sec16 n=1 Tax=Oldenlandia corymbosa var. corymbosa TaxID=529605 RepID=A0AAV1CJA1_OLDCO|nr:OLC1v1031809C1 [Oldenlandia corymbosa var. corymbosa]
MASSPPFLLEDQTDEDFFDKLVDDDDDDVGLNKVTATSSAPVFTDGDESDEIKAFANLSINETDDSELNDTDKMVEGADDSGIKVGSEPNGEVKEVDGNGGGFAMVEQAVVHGSNGALQPATSFDFGTLESSNSFDFASALEGNQETVGTDVFSNGNLSESDHTGANGIKQVQWSAFSTSGEQMDNSGFGSYSDFFSDLGENADQSSGNVANDIGYEATTVSGNELPDSNYSQRYGSNHDGANSGTDSQQTAGIQDPNSIEYLESLYPGWKIDRSTGQWYSVDDYNAGANVQAAADASLSGDWATSDGKTDVSYLQNSVQSVAGTVNAGDTTGSVTNWNQAPHVNDTSDWNQVPQGNETGASIVDWNQTQSVNHVYPPHMVFDPQFPDWYYDTNDGEWYKLDTYFASLQSASETQNKVTQMDSRPFESLPGSDYKNQSDMYGQVATSQGFGAETPHYDGAQSFGHYNQQVHQEATVTARSSSEYKLSQQSENHFRPNFGGSINAQEQLSGGYWGTQSSHEQVSVGQNQYSGGSHNLVNAMNLTPQWIQPRNEQKQQSRVSGDIFPVQNSVNFSQHVQGAYHFSPAMQPGRSSDGRPPCALVTFGFGGKLIVAKGSNFVGTSSFEGQNPIGSSISVLNFMDVVADNVDASDYLRSLCRQSFPGPLSGGSTAVNKWIDERISSTESPHIGHEKREVLKLLLSLLKISVQYQGKLRSPFGADVVLKENEAEAAIAKLLASPKLNDTQFSGYGPVAHCLQQLPSEGQLRATAAEVQILLVSGKKKEALKCAQDGQLWGPALVLAAQLGEQFYVETVTQMALKQLVPGSPLRTLCLLIAAQPAAVFTADDTAINSVPGGVAILVCCGVLDLAILGEKGMLDDWKENLAVITANRTKDDELVLIHLGDCLWKENSDVFAAHMCYLVAEANFEPYSDIARLCLIGADHWKFPRTYASPEAIQRTEVYEYSKVLGNPQFILLPFQPYKLVYAHMLVEVGRVSDALKYCQAVLKALKNGRSPEVETLRQVATSLEDRIKSHQQGGFSMNLVSGKLGKIFNFIDSTAHRVVGLPPAPSQSIGNVPSTESHFQTGARVSTSQSTMAMSSLMPSAVEPSNGWTDSNKRSMHNRSVSEPDFGRSPRQDQVDGSTETSASSTQGETSSAGNSRFRRFGSQIFQKLLTPRGGRQAKLGDENKFYFDQNLKMWVEKGAEPPSMETAPPPLPTSTFQNGTSDYNLKTALKSEGPPSNGSPEYKTPPLDPGVGIPPLPPTTNQYSARSRVGVRSRYVDTFNKGGGNQTNLYQSPPVSSIKPSISANANANGKFFVPAPVSSNVDTTESHTESVQNGHNITENPSISSAEVPFQSPPPSSSTNMQRFGSMNSISSMKAANPNGRFASNSRRTASWSGGSFPGSFSPEIAGGADARPLAEVLKMSRPAMRSPGASTLMHSSGSGGSFGDELQDVDL